VTLYHDYADYWNKPDSVGLEWQIEMADKWQYRIGEWKDARWVNVVIPSLKEVKSIVDVGAGSGRFFPLWNKLGLKAVGIEWSDVLYPLMQKNAEKYGFGHHRLDLRVPFNIGKFDIVFASQVLLHIEPSSVDEAFDNLQNLCGKYMILIVWYDPDKVRHEGNYYDGITVNSFSHPYPDLFDKYGFKVIESDVVGSVRGWVLKR